MVKPSGLFLSLLTQLVLFICCASQRTGPPCPRNWDLGPCECGGFPGAPSLTCSSQINSTILNQILKSAAEKLTFRDISLHDTSLNELQSSLFSPHEFYLFFLSNNSVEKVENNAFKGSEKTAQVIRLDGNKLTSFSYEALSGLKKLEVIQLNRNKLTSVDDNAFPELPSLKFVDMSFNKIASIGKASFALLSNLERLDLSNNQITHLEERGLTIDNHKQSIQINLAHNNINKIDKAAFSGLKAPLIDLTNNNLTALDEKVFGQLCKDGAEIIVENNPFECSAPEMSWLRTLSFTTKQRISGLLCGDGTTLDEFKLNLTLPHSMWDKK